MLYVDQNLVVHSWIVHSISGVHGNSSRTNILVLLKMKDSIHQQTTEELLSSIFL